MHRKALSVLFHASHPTRHRALRTVALVAFGIGAVACGKDTPTQPGSTGGGVKASSLVIRDGDLQSGPAGSVLAQPLQVTAKDAANAAVAGATVHFRVSAGAPTGTTVSDSLVVSGFDGTARVFVQLGSALDTSRVDAFLVAGQAGVTFRLVGTAPPQLASITPASFGAGDTLTVRGSGFNSNSLGNTVYLGSTRARIIGGSGDSVLTVVAPPCVSAGVVQARVLVGSAPTNTVSATFAPGRNLLSLAVNEGITVAGTDLGSCLRLLAGGAQYLLVPQSGASVDPSRLVDYTLGASGATTPSRVGPNSVVVPWAPGAGSRGTLQQQFDGTLRRLEHEITLRYRGTIGPHPQLDVAQQSAAAAVPALGSTRSFNVLGSLDGTTFVSSTAALRFAGNHILLYVDADQPSGSFTNAELTAFGEWFERDLYDEDVRVFGSESDIDGNGHVIVLMSPRINQLTSTAVCSTQGFVTGFFYGGDLITNSRGSNKGEVFYALVPDDQGSKSCAHSKAVVQRLIPATFIHEFQHMISYNQHVLARGGSDETLWLNEGLSHIAEELGSKIYEQRYPPPTGRTSPDQLFPDSSQGFIQGDMVNSYRFLNTLPQHTAVALSGSGSLEERGGAWLFLRWLGDQEGEGVYARLVQTSRTGTDNIADKTGETFAGLFGDFATAVYTDSIPGVARTSVPARLRFVSRNLRRIYQRFFDTQATGFDKPFPIVPRPLEPGLSITSGVLQGSMEYYTLDTPTSGGSVAIQFTRSDGTTFLATDLAQIGIYRLK